MSEFTLRIENMHCGSCVRRVSQALAGVPELEVKEVRIGAARVAAVADAEQPGESAAKAVAALQKAGYPAQLES